MLIGLNFGDQYLNLNLHHTSMYPCGTNFTIMNILWHTYGNNKFYENMIWNGLELFIYSDHTCALADRISVSCTLFTFLSMVEHCNSLKQPYIATH